MRVLEDVRLDAKIPTGPLASKWSNHLKHMPILNPANKKKHKVIVVGTGLAGGSAAATLGELGYEVLNFCFQDSPRRAHSVAAQGGINACKNYHNDGDSVDRFFYETIKGGDFRSREANVYRMTQLSTRIIDHCVAMGVPFAREYGGLLDNRSFGGAQVSRTFYARGQTGQQLLLGCYAALSRQIAKGSVKMFSRTEMLDVVIHETEQGPRAVGIVTRDLITGKVSSWSADAVVLATGGYSPVFYLSTNAKGCNVTATFRAYRRGALFSNPCYTQIHPTCIPPHGDHQSKLTLMSESLRNDGRVWVPRKAGDNRSPSQIPDSERNYFLEETYKAYGNLAPRDIASRAAKIQCDQGFGVGPGGQGVYLDFSAAIAKQGKAKIEEKYSNLFDMYDKITGEDPYQTPMRIYPAPHYTMGGLWVDYNLMSNIPGLFVIGEANFSDHGANRLGASALLQGLVDGYFVLPNTIGGYFDQAKKSPVDETHSVFRQTEGYVKDRINKFLSNKGNRSADSFHRELGKLMWDKCGMGRNRRGLEEAIQTIPDIRERFWSQVRVTGSGEELNAQLETAGRVADFIELAEILCLDALTREESCGGHFREEYQDSEGEADRNDEDFSHVSCWKSNGVGTDPDLIKEPLIYEETKRAKRSYK